MSAPRAIDWPAWGMLAALGVIWGGSFTVVGFAVRDLPPLTVAAARLGIAAIVLTPLAMVIGPGLPSFGDRLGRKIWLHALGVAIASNAAPFALLAWAQTHVASGLAGVLMAAMPLIALPLAAAFVPGDRMTLTKIVGFVIGFVGVATLIGVDALQTLGGGDVVTLLAQAACLLAVLGYATGSVVTKLSPKTHPLSFGAAAMCLATLIGLPLAFALEDPLAAPWAAHNILAAVYLGAVPTALAMLILFALVQRSGPSFFSLVNYQVPVWAMVFGVVFLGESVPARAPLALVLILLGVAISQGAAQAARRWLVPAAAKAGRVRESRDASGA